LRQIGSAAGLITDPSGSVVERDEVARLAEAALVGLLVGDGCRRRDTGVLGVVEGRTLVRAARKGARSEVQECGSLREDEG